MDTVLEQVKYYSEKAGDVVRQLSLAGIAIIWLVHGTRVEKGGTIFGTPLGNDLKWPVILIVGGLFADAFHYAIGALLWSFQTHSDTIDSHRCIQIVNGFVVVVKILLVLVGYVCLGFALLDQGIWGVQGGG